MQEFQVRGSPSAKCPKKIPQGGEKRSGLVEEKRWAVKTLSLTKCAACLVPPPFSLRRSSVVDLRSQDNGECVGGRPGTFSEAGQREKRANLSCALKKTTTLTWMGPWEAGGGGGGRVAAMRGEIEIVPPPPPPPSWPQMALEGRGREGCVRFGK